MVLEAQHGIACQFLFYRELIIRRTEDRKQDAVQSKQNRVFFDPLKHELFLAIAAFGWSEYGTATMPVASFMAV